MSILDNLSSDVENNKLDPNNIDFKSILDRNSDDGVDFLCSIGENTTKIMSKQKKDGSVVNINFRMLTSIEEIKMNTFVEKLKSILPVKIHEGHKHLSDLILTSIMKIMIATTPKLSNTATLSDYNINAKLNIKDMLDCTSETLALVLKEYESLENEFNPSISNIKKEEVQKLVEWVKKPEIPLSRLTYEQSLIVLDYLLEQKELEDKL